MLEDNLEINLITYNRAKALDRTLTELRESPFATCKITVLDNCSTDETPEVCARHRGLYPNLRVLRHKRNMGLSANYLRAVEISESLYTWVLCDDDHYDFSDCSDVIEAIEETSFDWICMGAPGQQTWERGLKTTTQELWKRGARFFYVHTFIPSLIFKTERFDSECLTLGYRNAVNSYPQHPFIYKALKENFTEYVARRQIVSRDTEQSAFGGLHWLTVAFSTSANISDPYIRRRCIYEPAKTRVEWLKMIGDSLMMGKLQAPEKVPRQFLQLVLACTGEQRNRLLTLTPLILIPSSVYKLMRSLRRFATGRTSGYTDDPASRPKEDAGTDHFRA